jgi:hypothetical protein
MQSLEQRFWNKVDRSGDCWIWTGSRSQSGRGYGVIGIGKHGKANAHHVSWALANGRGVPDGAVVLHSCDNKACVRPEHLSIGTQSQNIIDAGKRGRLKNAKLTDTQVLEIRASSESSMVLARRYGVNDGHIRKVKTGRAKSHVVS